MAWHAILKAREIGTKCILIIITFGIIIRYDNEGGEKE